MIRSANCIKTSIDVDKLITMLTKEIAFLESRFPRQITFSPSGWSFNPSHITYHIFVSEALHQALVDHVQRYDPRLKPFSHGFKLEDLNGLAPTITTFLGHHIEVLKSLIGDQYLVAVSF